MELQKQHTHLPGQLWMPINQAVQAAILIIAMSPITVSAILPQLSDVI